MYLSDAEKTIDQVHFGHGIALLLIAEPGEKGCFQVIDADKNVVFSSANSKDLLEYLDKNGRYISRIHYNGIDLYTKIVERVAPLFDSMHYAPSLPFVSMYLEYFYNPTCPKSINKQGLVYKVGSWIHGFKQRVEIDLDIVCRIAETDVVSSCKQTESRGYEIKMSWSKPTLDDGSKTLLQAGALDLAQYLLVANFLSSVTIVLPNGRHVMLSI